MSDFADVYLLALLYVAAQADSKQSEFDAALRLLQQRCKPAFILNHCFATGNWSAASAVRPTSLASCSWVICGRRV